MQILIADIGVGTRDSLTRIADAGFSPIYATSLPETVQLVRTEAPHAILAYVDADSAALTCAVLRALGETPLLVASAGLPSDIVRECLERGADYVLAKPLSIEELAAWVRAAIRRSTEQPAAPRQHQVLIDHLTIDLYTRRVWRRGIPVDLTRREFQLLAVLAEHPGRVVENHELLSRVWGPEYVNDVQNVRQYMGYLRAKLEDDPRHPEYILTVRGVGYRLAESHRGTPVRSTQQSSNPPCRRKGRRSATSQPPGSTPIKDRWPSRRFHWLTAARRRALCDVPVESPAPPPPADSPPTSAENNRRR
jgi:DNA-binding response OmpR family regulator